MAQYFVQPGGNDSNDGRDNIGVGLSTATWTESTHTLTQAGHGHSFVAGDVIYLSGGTGVTTGLYQVTGVTSNDILLAETSSLPGVGNASDVAAGDLSTGDITSSDGPRATIQAASNLLADNTLDRVWIRGGTDYTEMVTFAHEASNEADRVEYVGYTSTLGDNGRFVVDGESSRDHAFDNSDSGPSHTAWINMEVKNCNAQCVDIGGLEAVFFKNCYFHDSAGGVFSGTDHISADRCVFDTLTGVGIEGDQNVVVTNCTFADCTGSQCIRGEQVTVVGCLFYGGNNNLKAVEFFFDGISLVCNNTIVGVEGNASGAIFMSGSGQDNLIAFNNIIVDWDTAFEHGTTDMTGNLTYSIYNNLLFSNGTDYTQMPTGENHVTSDPSFVDSGSDDYSLPSTSPAIGAGVSAFDNSDLPDGSSNQNIGAQQSAVTGGGGTSGLLSGTIM